MNLILTDKVNKKINYYINSLDAEIGGIAKGKIEGDNITVTDCILLKQIVTDSTIVFDEDYMVKFLYELQKKGEATEDYNIRWHSHADLGAFWSTVDEDDIQTYKNQPYLISLVVNKKNEMKARLDLWPKDTSPFKIPMTLSKELNIIIQTPEDAKLKAKCLKEVKKQVKINKLKITPPKSQYKHGIPNYAPKYNTNHWWDKKEYTTEEKETLEEYSANEEYERELGFDTTKKTLSQKYDY